MAAATPAMTFAWVRQTPLGVPVEPEVYMIHASRSGVGGLSGWGEVAPRARKSVHDRNLASGRMDFREARAVGSASP